MKIYRIDLAGIVGFISLLIGLVLFMFYLSDFAIMGIGLEKIIIAIFSILFLILSGILLDMNIKIRLMKL